MVKHIFLDAEFNDHVVLVFCFLDELGQRYEIDCRTAEGRAELAVFVGYFRDQGVIWVSYSVTAEMEALLRCGVPIVGMKWFDLMTEGSMITRTFEVLYTHRPKLLVHLDAFKIAHQPTQFKEDMRQLILSKNEFSDDEFRQITEYCWTDVIPLPTLYDMIVGFHKVEDTPWKYDHALWRGEYSKACSILSHRSKGFPVNEAWLQKIFQNRKSIRAVLATLANAEYGFPLYQYNHVSQDYSFSNGALKAYIDSQPWGIEWGLTPSGLPRTDRQYIDGLIKQFPNVRTFGWVQDGMAQLKTDHLLTLVRHDEHGDAYVKPRSVPFYTVTGRNQPMVSGGFILNMPPWLRSVVRPHKGRVLIAADWGKQEVAIGCALSGDEALLKAYLTGDIYLTLAKMAGAVPGDATKESHPIQRQTYKSVQLGLGYGMGEPSLARQIYNDINAGSSVVVRDLDWCTEQAKIVYAWHKRTFRTYWHFLKKEAANAKARGWNTSFDGWLYFADSKTKHTRLINFPSQSNGAAMLRLAIEDLAFNTDLNVVCSLHDAIYIECDEEDAAEHKAILKACMDRAAQKIVGTIPIHVDFKTYTHERGYYDGRGAETLQMIRDIIKEIEINGAPIPPPRPTTKRKSTRQIKGVEFI